jgi:hypothetical protein
MKLFILILLFISNCLFLYSCSIVGLTTGIIIDLKSYEEMIMNKDTLKTLTSDDWLKIQLKNGETHYGKFNRFEILNNNKVGTSITDIYKDSLSTSNTVNDWNIVIDKKQGVSGFSDDEIKQIKIHQRTYAPIRGFALGFMIDFIVYNFLKNNVPKRIVD